MDFCFQTPVPRGLKKEKGVLATPKVFWQILKSFPLALNLKLLFWGKPLLINLNIFLVSFFGFFFVP
ncbi:MAG: hypothetical protein CM15mP109_08830 [Candidatus Dadabacteria bacterium]|nr:MAG: hypothetical protein CM15mP109_08830 [Candidatus Dadabacteria bacterium]